MPTVDGTDPRLKAKPASAAWDSPTGRFLRRPRPSQLQYHCPIQGCKWYLVSGEQRPGEDVGLDILRPSSKYIGARAVELALLEHITGNHTPAQLLELVGQLKAEITSLRSTLGNQGGRHARGE